jgi:hypothetical protein
MKKWHRRLDEIQSPMPFLHLKPEHASAKIENDSYAISSYDSSYVSFQRSWAVTCREIAEPVRCVRQVRG